MSAFERLMEFCRENLGDKPKLCAELLMIADQIKTEAKKEIITYARNNGGV